MLGYETAVVNGQMIPIAPRAGYDPIAFGPAYTGPGMWPRQGVYNVPPVLPSGTQRAHMAPAAYGGVPGAPYPTSMSETGNPWHLTKSPLPWGIGFLAVGLGMLHFIHYR